MSTAVVSGQLRHPSEMNETHLYESGWDSEVELHFQHGGATAALDVPGRGLRLKALCLNPNATIREAVYIATKRVMDVSFSIVALILLSPVFLAAAILIKLYDFGPVFFCQARVGQNGREFRCYKFRSMIRNAEALQESLLERSEHADRRTFKISNDPRITPPGRIIRRFSIDELPQILNVLLGQMSIVGPRPPLPNEVSLYSDSDFQRLTVKPGLTCTWQVSGRSRLPFPEQVRLDLDYIQRRSLALDLNLILRTIPAVLGGDGAV